LTANFVPYTFFRNPATILVIEINMKKPTACIRERETPRPDRSARVDFEPDSGGGNRLKAKPSAPAKTTPLAEWHDEIPW
jgi:hypothetical protein